VLALGVLPLVGCGDSDGTAGSGGSGGSGGTGGMAKAAVHMLLKSWPEELALEGVEVCEMDTDNCVMSGDDGFADIELPAEQEVAFTLKKEGFGSYLTSAIYPRGGDSELFAIATEQRLADMHALVGSPFPMESTGSIYVSPVYYIEGMSFTLIGSDGKPYYRDENQDWDPDLSVTTTGGGGGFTEVSPGVVQLEINGADCTLIRGWPGDAQNRFRVPIKEGFVSRIYVNCQEPLE